MGHQQGENIMRPGLLIAAAILAASTSAATATQCMVSDPTGTPLNIRETPDGEVIGRLRNGTFVTMVDTVQDRRGRRWAIVRAPGYGGTVSVFREFISCR
jgi:hypothetical protein